MGSRAAVQAVAVILEVLAHVVGVTVAAEMAVAAGDIGSGHDTVPGFQRTSLAVVDLTTGRDHLADILMTANERVGQILFVRRSGILLGFAAEGVLVGTADSGVVHLHDHCAGCRIRHRKFAQHDDAWTLGDRCPNNAHEFTRAVSGLPRASARMRAASRMPTMGPTNGSSCSIAMVFTFPAAARSLNSA